MYTHSKQILSSGVALKEAGKVMIMLHGRGAPAQSILSLEKHLMLDKFAVIAPQATNSSWYPYSFMAPSRSNEPALSSALDLIDQVLNDIRSEGFAASQLYFLGFSQGACLTLEYTARHADTYGGIIAFTGGLIGEQLDTGQYTGNFNGSRILISTSDPDPHVPLERVYESEKILEQLGAQVQVETHQGKPHSIFPQEIELANSFILS